jgi:hypothetical protein
VGYSFAGDVGVSLQYLAMGEVVIGTEAVARGTVTRHELARWYRPFYPNVHAPRWHELTLADRTVGAWLWSKREGIVTGVAASAVHGAEWVEADVDIELIHNNTRPPQGITARNERIADDEFTWAGFPLATPARTAFDLARYAKRDQAIVRMDALMRARPFSVEDVLLLAKRYRGARGVKLLKDVLPLVDGGAASPRETRLRLLFIDAGLPTPATQLPVFGPDGRVLRTVDMAWEEFMIIVEYDGDQHRTSREQYVKDHRVIPVIESLGWIVIRVIKEDRPDDVVRRTRNAMASRGWRP